MEWKAVLIFTFFAIQLMGQKEMKSVEVVLDNGKIRTGTIRYDRWQPYSDPFIFRPTGNSLPIYMGLDSIAELRIGEEPEDERYLGYKGPVSVFSSDSGTLPEGAEISYQEDTILLRALVLGTANLYLYTAPDDTRHFFISDGNGAFTELIAHRYRRSETDRRIRHHDEFRGQLRELLSDCEWLSDWIQEVTADELELKELLVEYNSCDEQKKLLYVGAPPGRRIAIAVTAGAAFTRVSRKEDQIINIGTGQVVPRFGLSAKWCNKENPDISAWLIEALYSPFKTSDETGEIEVNTTYLQANLLYQSSWPSGKNWPYFLIGPTYSARLSLDRQDGLPAQVLVDHMLGLAAGFGVQSGRLRMDLRYEINNMGLLFPQSPSYYANTLSLLAAYQLWSNQ